MQIRFRKIYFICTVILFITELIIGFYVHDNIVRPFIGDLLVVILIYTFLQTFFILPVWKTAAGVLLFSFLIEWLQYLQIVTLLGLDHLPFFRIIIGTSFEWIDIGMYIIGIVIVLVMEYMSGKLCKIQNK